MDSIAQKFYKLHRQIKATREAMDDAGIDVFNLSVSDDLDGTKCIHLDNDQIDDIAKAISVKIKMEGYRRYFMYDGIKYFAVN